MDLLEKLKQRTADSFFQPDEMTLTETGGGWCKSLESPLICLYFAVKMGEKVQWFIKSFAKKQRCILFWTFSGGED